MLCSFVQNAAVRLVCKVNHYERLSVTSLTKYLHWLKVKERVTFKVLVIIHKVLIEAAPPAFKSMFKSPVNQEIGITNLQWEIGKSSTNS